MIGVCTVLQPPRHCHHCKEREVEREISAARYANEHSRHKGQRIFYFKAMHAYYVCLCAAPSTDVS